MLSPFLNATLQRLVASMRNPNKSHKGWHMHPAGDLTSIFKPAWASIMSMTSPMQEAEVERDAVFLPNVKKLLEIYLLNMV